MSSISTGDAVSSTDKEPWATILCPHTLLSIEKTAAESTFSQILAEPLSRELVGRFARYTIHPEPVPPDSQDFIASPSATMLELAKAGLKLAFASLAAFLQANVTGPVLTDAHSFEAVFLEHFTASTNSEHSTDGPKVVENTASPQTTIENLRFRCQRSLDTDGVSPYPHIPYIELFCLARFLLATGGVLPSAHSIPLAKHLAWSRLRVNLWHYKLLTQPSLGPGSLYTKSGRWTDVATLQELIQASLTDAETALFGSGATSETIQDFQWPSESQILFRLEEANCHILLGNDTKALQALEDATRLRGFIYALSGALGKRTRFQENSFSQLVVLAKSLQLSSESTKERGEKETAPSALLLNDDTLLEKIQFNNDELSQSGSSLPIELQKIKPDDQPKLHPVDQIILLTEATLKDTFSPSDTLTLEEILPYAVRVINDESVNWQIYTQALLVRSRIELNRSRTVERGVLQMQAVADQVIADTQDNSPSTTAQQQDSALDVPGIVVTSDGEPATHVNNKKPTSFLPAPKPSESATPEERLRYVNALASPPRWHLESELAYAWTSVGSLVSALEIFKRLRLWPEVALCLATAGASDDGSGRGAGGEEKARAIVRWQLFKRSTDSSDGVDDEDKIDLDSIKPGDFHGPERSPPPPNAPRLFCILGDMENDASHYTRAWEISNRRFARAQKSLGEFYLQNKEWDKARQAYQQAVGVNRLSPELWNRLGDIELRMGHFPDAAEAFQRGIATANGKEGGEDARTWSNLGTAYLSWYREVLAEAKARKAKTDADDDEENDDSSANMPSTQRAAELGRSASQLLQDSLSAFKRGATIANSNWRIWDNVITLAASLKPVPALDDVLLGVKNVVRIRQTESALDPEILALLVREVTKTPAPVRATNNSDSSESGIHDPPRGSLEHKVLSLFETEIVPLITSSSTAWDLVSRLRAWKRDYGGALDAAEKSWRAAINPGSVGSTLSASSGGSQEASWLTDAEKWDVVVQRTADLVAAYENYGARIEGIGDRWRGKTRSAVRSVLGKAKEAWEGDERWLVLKDLMDGLR
ncbi:hypothetical protein F5B22DRAFT_378862 [Xylaria bambusicola]|uniref:uncharacterized protein n=1 Tax=Xylaria bambusicola TaxID=326684 RepID=UPI002008BD43|nr:uncharacterized protein F5B22DRAFT_378862 [Xylaria bambusicola]KAI0508874.1 hypothetical protein F5B22DRAFT_378862 [Xylaria bambusicola]